MEGNIKRGEEGVGNHSWTRKEFNWSPFTLGIKCVKQSRCHQVPSVRSEFSARSGIYCWPEAQAGAFTYLQKEFLFPDYLKIRCIPVLIAPANFNRLHKEGEGEV